MSQEKRRYAVVGTGGRSGMYIDALCTSRREDGELVALCDANIGRARKRQAWAKEMTGVEVPVYEAADFEKMLDEQSVDRVIVTTGPDRTHRDYIVRAMRAGRDVVTEKPMTTTDGFVREILATKKETGRDLQVTFNYRYSPPRSHVRRLISEGAIGEILSVDFAWRLDTRHGADYFRRWHRNLDNSGSLLVHKATHHFDLVNWWIDDLPEEVFAHGSRRYYTPEQAVERGLGDHAERCTDCTLTGTCPFYLDLDSGAQMRALYRENEHIDGYYRDRCVFSKEIDIWDTMSLSVRYRKGAILNYMLHAYSPTEGYSIAFNGTKGRIEHYANEASYVSGDGNVPGELQSGKLGITLIPEFQAPRAITPEVGEGGHGGGDPALLSDVFDPSPKPDPLRRRANEIDGAYSVLIGVAGYTSIRTGKAVTIEDLLQGT